MLRLPTTFFMGEKRWCEDMVLHCDPLSNFLILNVSKQCTTATLFHKSDIFAAANRIFSRVELLFRKPRNCYHLSLLIWKFFSSRHVRGLELCGYTGYGLIEALSKRTDLLLKVFETSRAVSCCSLRVLSLLFPRCTFLCYKLWPQSLGSSVRSHESLLAVSLTTS